MPIQPNVTFICGTRRGRARRHLVALVVAVTVGWPAASPAQESTNESLEQREGQTATTTATEDAPEKDPELQQRIHGLLEQLGGSSLSDREQAQLELMKLGPNVLDYLPDDVNELSSEARRRLEQVQVELERERAMSAAEPTSVSIGDATTVGEAFAQLTQQTGNELSGRYDESQEITPPKGEMHFWKALDHVLDEANLDVDPYSGASGAIGVSSRRADRPSRAESAIYSGVFRIEPAMVTTRRNLTDPRLSELRVLVDVSWEPRATPVRLSLPLKSIRAELSDGTVLPVQESGGEPETTPQPDLPVVELSIPLMPPPRGPKEIQTLSGTLSATLPGKSQKYKFALDKQIPSDPKRTGNVTVQLERLTPNGPLHEARLAIRFEDAGLALESHRTWIFENPVYVLDADGFRKDPLGLEVYRQSAEEVGIGYLFDLSGAPAGHQLIYESPAAIIQTEVPFKLQNVPLP